MDEQNQLEEMQDYLNEFNPFVWLISEGGTTAVNDYKRKGNRVRTWEEYFGASPDFEEGKQQDAADRRFNEIYEHTPESLLECLRMAYTPARRDIPNQVKVILEAEMGYKNG